LGTINRGLITGERDKYFSTKKETKSHVPILTGSDVHRYHVLRPSNHVRFVRPAGAGGCWDPEMHFAPHKVLVRQIGEQPTASIILQPMAVTGNIFTVRAATPELEKYILAIVNSRLTAFYWRTLFADFKGSFPQVTIFSLAQLPIRPINSSKSADKAAHDHMVSLVDSMLELHKRLAAAKSEAEKTVIQRQIGHTDAEIDRLVYDLYGLTAEEIRIVEESS
jgi:hypothetical protein